MLFVNEKISYIISDNEQKMGNWYKQLKSFCRLSKFMEKYKFDIRLFDNYYRCLFKKQRIYNTVQVIKKHKFTNQKSDFINQNITMLKSVDNSLIMKVQYIYEDPQNIYICYPYLHGETLLKVSIQQDLPEKFIALIAHHILKGLKSMHSNDFYHGNIKLENIVLTSQITNNNLIYFLNNRFSKSNNDYSRKKQIKKGKNYYCAPEVLSNQAYNHQIDLFQLGVSLYYLFFKTFPYKEIFYLGPKQITYEMNLSILEKIKKTLKVNPEQKQLVTLSCADFLEKLLENDPKQRITAQAALKHQWLVNLLNPMDKKSKKSKKNQIKKILEQRNSLKTIMECTEYNQNSTDKDYVSIKNFFNQMSVFSNYQPSQSHHSQNQQPAKNLSDNQQNDSFQYRQSFDSNMEMENEFFGNLQQQQQPNNIQKLDDFEIDMQTSDDTTYLQDKINILAAQKPIRYPLINMDLEDSKSSHNDHFNHDIMARTLESLQSLNKKKENQGIQNQQQEKSYFKNNNNSNDVDEDEDDIDDADDDDDNFEQGENENKKKEKSVNVITLNNQNNSGTGSSMKEQDSKFENDQISLK